MLSFRIFNSTLRACPVLIRETWLSDMASSEIQGFFVIGLHGITAQANSCCEKYLAFLSDVFFLKLIFLISSQRSPYISNSGSDPESQNTRQNIMMQILIYESVVLCVQEVVKWPILYSKSCHIKWVTTSLTHSMYICMYLAI